MKQAIRDFFGWKVGMVINFVTFCLIGTRLFELVLNANKISAMLHITLRQLPQFFNIETLGVPAFYQAEVMIVMSVMGIVALNTIPGFITDQQRNQIMLQLQKSYSVYSNGISLAINENGTPDAWGSNGTTTLSDINNTLSEQFKLMKNCNTESGCFPDVQYKNLKGVAIGTKLDQDPLYTKFKLLNGSSVAISQTSSSCSDNWGDTPQLQNVCGMLLVDVNGEKAPNTYGRDFFGFAFTKYGLIPLGTPEQSRGYPFSAFCSTTSNANFKYENGLSCTAWVMYNQNMDYLDCKGLNWNNGKTTCKS